MSSDLAQAETRPASPRGRAQTRVVERRRHQRVSVTLLGRYMLSDRQEYPCQVLNMSPGGVALLVAVKGAVGERVVCYLDHIGRVEGVIARVFENGFALQFSVPLIKREKLAEQLIWLANRHTLGMPEDRRHARIVPRNTRVIVRLADDSEHAAKLIDVSISGAAVTCDARPAVGSPVRIGNTPAQVVRVAGSGFAVEFVRMLPPESFDDTITL